MQSWATLLKIKKKDDKLFRPVSVGTCDAMGEFVCLLLARTTTTRLKSCPNVLKPFFWIIIMDLAVQVYLFFSFTMKGTIRLLCPVTAANDDVGDDFIVYGVVRNACSGSLLARFGDRTGLRTIFIKNFDKNH